MHSAQSPQSPIPRAEIGIDGKPRADDAQEIRRAKPQQRDQPLLTKPEENEHAANQREEYRRVGDQGRSIDMHSSTDNPKRHVSGTFAWYRPTRSARVPFTMGKIRLNLRRAAETMRDYRTFCGRWQLFVNAVQLRPILTECESANISP